MVEVKLVIDNVNYDDVFRKYMDTHFFKGTVGYFMSREMQEREILRALNTDGCGMLEGMARKYSVYVRAGEVTASSIGMSALEIICRLSDVDYNSLFRALVDNTYTALRWLVLGISALTWRGMKEFLTLTLINMNGRKIVKKAVRKNGIRMNVRTVHASHC